MTDEPKYKPGEIIAVYPAGVLEYQGWKSKDGENWTKDGKKAKSKNLAKIVLRELAEVQRDAQEQLKKQSELINENRKGN